MTKNRFPCYAQVISMAILPLLLLLIPGCGSGGGGGGDSVTSIADTTPATAAPAVDTPAAHEPGAPVISNLRLSPGRAGWTTGPVVVTGTFDFTDADGDISKFTLTTFNPSGNVIPNTPDGMASVSGVTAGTISITTRIAPAVRGNYGYQVSVQDSKGLESEKLTALFTLVPETDPWTTKAPMPTARAGVAAAVLDGKLYALGGYDIPDESRATILNIVERYDPVSDTWITMKPMPTPRHCLGAAVIDGKIYAIGGANRGISLRRVEEYDPATDNWALKAPMPTPRSDLGVVALNGRIYAIGGRNDETGADLTLVEEYDPATNTWRARTPMERPRYAPVVGVADGRIYAMSGLNEGAFVDTIEEYDPAKDTWTTVPVAMPTNRVCSWGVSLSGSIYAVGGSVIHSPADELISANLLDQYKPDTNAWASRTPMLTSRRDLAADVIEGKIYVIGGIESADRVSNKLEVYDPNQDF